MKKLKIPVGKVLTVTGGLLTLLSFAVDDVNRKYDVRDEVTRQLDERGVPKVEPKQK